MSDLKLLEMALWAYMVFGAVIGIVYLVGGMVIEWGERRRIERILGRKR